MGELEESPEVPLALESDEPVLFALDPVLELPPVDEAPVDEAPVPLEAVALVSDESVVVEADESVVAAAAAAVPDGKKLEEIQESRHLA